MARPLTLRANYCSKKITCLEQRQKTQLFLTLLYGVFDLDYFMFTSSTCSFFASIFCRFFFLEERWSSKWQALLFYLWSRFFLMALSVNSFFIIIFWSLKSFISCSIMLRPLATLFDKAIVVLFELLRGEKHALFH